MHRQVSLAAVNQIYVFHEAMTVETSNDSSKACFENENMLNKSENATLQLSMFCEKVLDRKHLLKLNNVSQTSSKRFVETPTICLV